MQNLPVDAPPAANAAIKLQRILLPLALPIHSLRTIDQVAFLARHFGAEILLLHVLTLGEYPAGAFESGHELSAQDLESPTVQGAQQRFDEGLRGRLDGLSVRRLWRRGLVGHEILQIAREQQVDLVALPMHRSHGLASLLSELLPKRAVLDCDCPIWTDAQDDVPAPRAFAMRRLLCSVDLSAHSRRTLAQAVRLAAEFRAELALVHVAPSLAIEGPGGLQVDEIKQTQLLTEIAQQLRQLQSELPMDTQLILETGSLVEGLNRAATRYDADLLIVGRLPPGHLGDGSGTAAITRAAQLPVLSL